MGYYSGGQVITHPAKEIKSKITFFKSALLNNFYTCDFLLPTSQRSELSKEVLNDPVPHRCRLWSCRPTKLKVWKNPSLYSKWSKIVMLKTLTAFNSVAPSGTGPSRTSLESSDVWFIGGWQFNGMAIILESVRSSWKMLFY